MIEVPYVSLHIITVPELSHLHAFITLSCLFYVYYKFICYISFGRGAHYTYFKLISVEQGSLFENLHLT